MGNHPVGCIDIGACRVSVRYKDIVKGVVRMRVYGIYEEGKLIFTGTDGEVKKRFGLTSGMNWYASQNHRILGKYDVKIVKDSSPVRDNNWDCLYMMLVVRKEKKTSIVRNPEHYVERLRECGVEVKYYPYWSLDCNETDITAPRQKRKQRKCWMVERV